MHLKRRTISKSWPIPRKGTKYLVVPSHDKENGIPLLLILRDLLGLAKDRKEVQNIINQKLVSVNGRTAKKANLSVLPLDIIEVGEKAYELTFSDNGKFEVRETARKEQILKVADKKILKNKKIQLNFLYGKNMISDEKINVGDSVILKEKKIIKILPMEKGKEVLIVAGKYKGQEGKIEKIENRMASISCKDKKIKIPVNNIMVVR